MKRAFIIHPSIAPLLRLGENWEYFISLFGGAEILFILMDKACPYVVFPLLLFCGLFGYKVTIDCKIKWTF